MKTAIKKKTNLAQPIYLVIWCNADCDQQIYVFCDEKEAKAKSKELERELGGNGEVGVRIKLVSEGCIDLDWDNPISTCGKATPLSLGGEYEE
jgi:hypothetical protein